MHFQQHTNICTVEEESITSKSLSRMEVEVETKSHVDYVLNFPCYLELGILMSIILLYTSIVPRYLMNGINSRTSFPEKPLSDAGKSHEEANYSRSSLASLARLRREEIVGERGRGL